MQKNLIYSCVFFNEKYIHLIYLLLKSYVLFGDTSKENDFLIICNHEFERNIQSIFDHLQLDGKIWCLNLNTKFDACWSRYKIFEYEYIDLYKKILYLDCDILVTNSIHKVLDIKLENKLYALIEGTTRRYLWGKHHFQGKNPGAKGFCTGILLFNNCTGILLFNNCTGILLFNNCTSIKDLFIDIIEYKDFKLKGYNGDKPESELNRCPLNDQPVVVYKAITNNLYNNTRLINLVVNNPAKYNGESISHFFWTTCRILQK